MGDWTYMQMTVYDCPSRRRKVAQLLAEYGLTVPTAWDEAAGARMPQPDEVAVGEQYTAEQVSLGTIGYLAAALITEAPRSSFLGWEDPAMSDDGPVPGELIAYSPRWGRFDGECTGGGAVVLDARQILALLDDADHRGWLNRDTMVRLHHRTMDPHVARFWKAMPGLREAVEVATAIPWQQDMRGEPAARCKRLAWQAVIDANTAAAAARHLKVLEEIAADMRKPSQTAPPAWPAWAQLAGKILVAPDAARPAEARAAAARIEADLTPAAKAAGKPVVPGEFDGLPYRLRNWADDAETAWQGRRRARSPGRGPAQKGTGA